jgi:hypothetical protein
MSPEDEETTNRNPDHSMKNPVIIISAGLFAATATFPHNVIASGSYCACLPKPPAASAANARGATARVDRDRFDLGQKVFNGQTAPARGNAKAQRPRLEALGSQLPAKVAKEKNLPARAGSLTNEQLDALEYYVAERYGR